MNSERKERKSVQFFKRLFQKTPHTKLVMELINPPDACSNMAACFLKQNKSKLVIAWLTKL